MAPPTRLVSQALHLSSFMHSLPNPLESLADVVAADTLSDLAVLRITDSSNRKFPCVKLGTTIMLLVQLLDGNEAHHHFCLSAFYACTHMLQLRQITLCLANWLLP